MSANRQEVFIVDDNESIRRSICVLLDSVALKHRSFSNAADFLKFYDSSRRGCLVLDIRLPGMNGMQLQQILKERGAPLPIIFITGHGDVPLAVEAMRHNAIDFLIKPFRAQELLDSIQRGLLREAGAHEQEERLVLTRERIASLTPRQTDVFEQVTQGKSNKAIAADLGICERTIEVHRSAMMRKMQARTLADLINMKLSVERSIQDS